MITVGILENKPFKTKHYLDSVLLNNNISNVRIVSSEKKADIAIVCNCNMLDFNNILPVIIINSDVEYNHQNQLEMKFPSVIIDCGISLKSSVTASSIFDGQINYCIQRGFNNFEGNEIAPQEFNISCDSDNENNIFAILAGITILLFSGISADKVKKYKF